MNAGKRWGLGWATVPAILGLALLGGTGARAQLVYASTSLTVAGATTNSIGTLDLATGSFQQLSTVGFQLYGLAYYQPNSGLYGIDQSNVLYSINRTTGATASQFTFTGLNGQFLQSIAVDQATNTLYGLASDDFQTTPNGSNATLYRLSTTNSAAVKIGTGLGFNTFGGLGIVTNNGVSTAYATQGVATNTNATGNGPLFQINLTTGTASALGGQTSAGFTNAVSALTGINGQLKAVDYGNSTGIDKTYNVNLTTGIATQQGTYNRASIGDVLAITSVVTPQAAPEPGTITLLASGLTVGLSGISVLRRRSNKKRAA